MPIFITQGRYSRDAIKGMIAKPEDRGPIAAKLVEEAGGRLLAYYVTFGEYDWLIVSEMPGPKEAATVALAAAAGSVTDVKTTLAMTTAEAREAFAATGRLMAGYKAPGTA